MKLGIVGLPNVGKSTLFNAITSTKNAAAANYPFCTIDPNTGVVPVPDARLDKLAEIWDTNKKTPAIVEFVDIAGLVKGASKGEGLGNKFLGNIRECDAIVHVVRCFEGTDIVHVEGNVDPVRDIETIDTELILSDLEVVSNRAARMAKAGKTGDKKALASAFLSPVLPALAIRAARLETTSRSLRISSVSMVSMSRTGSTLPSTCTMSVPSKQRTTCTMASHSRMLPKNLLPSPSPLDAPFTKPAMSTNSTMAGVFLLVSQISASLSSRASGTGTTPVFGSMVQNG